MPNRRKTGITSGYLLEPEPIPDIIEKEKKNGNEEKVKNAP